MRGLTRFRWPGVVTGLVLAAWLVTGSASGAGRDASSPVLRLHPAFHRVGVVAGTPLTDGRFVYLPRTMGPQSMGTVVDERTGARTAVARPGCAPTAAGGHWLLFDCPGPPARVALYRLGSGGWRTVAVPASIGYPQMVGEDWIDYFGDFGSCPDQGSCDSRLAHQFQNILTGRVVKGWGVGNFEAPGGSAYPNLNSPSLTGKLCRPLHVPADDVVNGGTVPGPLTRYGPFTVAIETSPAGTDQPVATAVLERCGSKLHRALYQENDSGALVAPAVQQAGNPDLVIWPSAPQRLSGLFLPTLQRFTLTIPHALGRVQATTGARSQIIVTAKTLYVLDGNQLWSTRIPKLPRH